MAALRGPESMSMIVPGNMAALDSMDSLSSSSSSPRSSGPPTPESNRRPSDPIAIPAHLKTRSITSASPNSTTQSAVCPNCGLRRRPSVMNVVETGGCSPSHFSKHNTTPTMSQNSMSNRYWSTNGCCSEWCPDSVRPTTASRIIVADDPIDLPPGRMLKGSNKRHHRRRRSSLCYAESFADDDEDIKISPSRDYVVDKQVVVKVAEVIAQKVVQRSRRSSQDVSYFDRTYC